MISFFLRNRVYLYLKEKRIVIVAKEVKIMVREPKYLKKLEGYPEHGVFHGEDRYLHKKFIAQTDIMPGDRI